ncbi:hypothetical protein GGR57DRAFT_293855 [Xylariaceae sp. FL1272]|nr:hypothetical protein GGR57DRAFT_293855 [Xylariaceae sp. FL1272]
MTRTRQPPRKSTGGADPYCVHRRRPLAVATAWAIPEIAENILAHLPMKDLLLAQGVSLSWRDLIRASPVLQMSLFMRPRHLEPAQNTSSNGVPIREINPLLMEHMQMWFCRDPDNQHRTVKDAPWAQQTVSRLAFLRRDASWRRMLLAQPPFTVFESAQMTHAMGGDSLSVGCIEQPEGVRMGLVYDQAAQSIQTYFYSLGDGMADPGAQNYDGHNSSETRERLFGGIDKFTLCCRRTHSCRVPSSETSRILELEQRQLTSAGFEVVDIEIQHIQGPPRRFSWYTKDGYRK